MSIVPMNPGLYLLHCRHAAGFSREDVAIRVETDPHVDAARRAALIRDLELGLLPVRSSTAQALASIPELAIDLDHLGVLIEAVPASADATLFRLMRARL